MLRFVGKDGKKLMEMTDGGDVTVFDSKLTGAGELKEDAQEGDKNDGADKE